MDDNLECLEDLSLSIQGAAVVSITYSELKSLRNSNSLTPGTSGVSGSSGTSGAKGNPGINGSLGTSGVSGLSGTSGSSGANGIVTVNASASSALVFLGRYRKPCDISGEPNKTNTLKMSKEN